MEKDEIKEIVKLSVQEALQEHRSIPADQHYMDHNWIKDWREWQENIKGTAWRHIVKTAISVVVALMFLGFILWGRSTLK